MYMKFWRTERDDVLAKGIIARRGEKARIKRIKTYTKRKEEVPEEDKCAIVDPEVEWKATNPTWLAEEAREARAKEKYQFRVYNQDNDEDDDNFIIDTVGDRERIAAMTMCSCTWDLIDR